MSRTVVAAFLAVLAFFVATPDASAATRMRWRPFSNIVDLTTEDPVLTLPDGLYDSETASRPAGRTSRPQA